LSDWQAFVATQGDGPLSRDPTWLLVLQQARGHVPYCVEAFKDGRVTGILPLSLVSGPLFGRFLVSLPHLSSGGICCDDPSTAMALADRAIGLADELDVDFLELRHTTVLSHAELPHVVTDKAHMRMELPSDKRLLWNRLGTKIRNQVRKADRFSFRGTWGGVELLEDFYSLYSYRMRDFGVPVDGRALFEQILVSFPNDAELFVVRQQDEPVAAAMILHGWGLSEMHRSATTLSRRATGVNTWLHWHALLRALERGNRQFDFGRPTVGSSVYTFKKRFGAIPHTAALQHYLRRGSPDQLRRSSGRFSLRTKLWSLLPISATRWFGPLVARGIP
jgi:FemAB-related protein (PEP-CTERM system-associated)